MKFENIKLYKNNIAFEISKFDINKLLYNPDQIVKRVYT